MKKFLFASLTLVLFALSGNAIAQHAENTEAVTAVGTMQPAEGLKIDLFAAEPLLMNPVAFSIDEKGRFFISETHRYREAIFDITKNLQWLQEDLAFRTVEERSAFLSRTFTTNFNILTNKSEIVRLVEDRDGDGKADYTSVFAEDFRQSISGTAAGILARDNAVWFTCIPNLWKLTDSNGDGVADHDEKLKSGFGVRIGVTGHDLHGLTMGPDGRLYFSIGDRAFAPPADIKGYGFTTAFLRRILPDTGAVFRCDPDGSNFEVFAIGLRNPQELTFDHLGNLWTVDNDTSGADDARVIHIVQGGDYGWRVSYQHQKNFGPWVTENLWRGGLDDVLPPAGVVAQGPAGLTYNPGPYLGERYQNAFFICDFPRGIWSFKVEPSGSSYTVSQKDHFVWGIWATDVDFGNDGSLYMADWTSGWNPNEKGRLYRVTSTQSPTTPTGLNAAKLRAEGFEQRSLKELLELLRHPDYRIRREAQFSITKRVNTDSSGKLTKAAISGLWTTAQGSDESARRHAFWALAQIGRQISNPQEKEELTRPLQKLLTSNSAETRRLSAWFVGETMTQGYTKELQNSLKDTAPSVAYAAAVSLGQLHEISAIPALAALAETNADKDPFLTHALVSAISNSDDPQAFSALVRSPDTHVHRIALLALRRLETQSIATFLNDSDPRLIVEAARAINDVPINSAMPTLASNLLAPSSLSTYIGVTNALDQFTKRAINAHYRLGQPTNAAALVSFAANTNNAVILRAEALDALADWAKPEAIDRVMGLWRPLPERDASPAKQALQREMPKFLASNSAPLLNAAIESAAKLGLKESSPALLKVFQNSKLALSARISALNALNTLAAPELPQAVKIALEGQNLSLRRAGVRLMGQAHVPDASSLLERLASNEPDIRLAQAAYAALGEQSGQEVDSILVHHLEKLLQGDIRKELQLDLLDAAQKHPAKEVQQLLQQYAKLHHNQGQYSELLSGGDPAAGRHLLTSRMDVECLRCHQVGVAGGIVGPSLNGVGNRLTKTQLLESILLPNQQIAIGYENATFVLKDGRNASGLVKSETPGEVVVESPEDGVLTIKKSEVVRRVASLSAMPEGLGERLTRKELRDVVEYLSNLKK